MKKMFATLILCLASTYASAFCITNSTRLDLTIKFSKDNLEWNKLELKGGKDICYSEDLPPNTSLHFDVTAIDNGWFSWLLSAGPLYYQFDADSESHLLYVLRNDDEKGKEYHMYTDG